VELVSSTKGESHMNKPRIFIGSSGKQARLLESITRGLEDVADVEPWTTTFNPGRSTLDRLVELSQEVDFAAFVFAQDDWTTTDASQFGQASPRDNVVFEAAVMVAVFFTFALSGPLPPKEMGVILGVAVLLDAMLVRLVLIPTLVRVFGRHAWARPRWLGRLLPMFVSVTPDP
jgi:hypothetical protein